MRYKFLPSFVKRRGRITSSQEDNLKLLPNLAINSYDDICSAKKDFSKLILEIGFGMGICSNFIQQHQIKSHTIIEIHDEVFEKLLLWAKDKPNVTPIKGSWVDSIPNKQYDGVMLDTWKDNKNVEFKKLINI